MKQSVLIKSLGLLFLLCAFGFSLQGQSKSALTNEKKKLEQEIASQRKLLENTKKNRNLSLREIQLIKNQIQSQEKLIKTINEEIQGIENQIVENQKELDLLTNRLELLKEGYSDAVLAAHKYRNAVNKAGFVLSAADISQAITRMNYLAQYSRAMKNQLYQIIQTQENIKKKGDLLAQNKEEKSHLIEAKNKEKINLSKQEKDKQKLVSSLKKKENQINEQIKKKRARQKNIDATIQRIINEEVARANAKKKTTETSKTKSTSTPSKSTVLMLTPEEKALASNFESNKGKLPWPVEKGNIVGKYGTYSHPEISSVQITNNGINILTEKGANVRTIFNGTVSAVADINGLKAVIIKHGNYFSVYTNLTYSTVKQGQTVTTKQTIGKLAQESGDPNSELHFEILKERVHQNPSTWIAR